MRVAGSFGSLYTPSMSVRNASFSAFMALAMAQAASSALILYVWNSSSIPTGQTTGRKSFSRRSCKICASTFLISPTNPISSPLEYFFSTFRSPPSFPLIPMARTPCPSRSCTRLLFTFPSTISATSIVSSSVTRSPLINCGSLPIFSTHLLISFPPPCTMIGLKPTSFNKVTSSITFCFNASSVMALPPYFTTMIFRLKRWIYGSASISTFAFSRY